VKVLVLGAGAVGTVSALKFVQLATTEKLVIADAVSARASLLADRLNDSRVSALQLDASNQAELTAAIRLTGTTIVLNAALPATNIAVMRACLEAGCDYIDLASAGTDADGIPKMADQFALDAEFKAAGGLHSWVWGRTRGPRMCMRPTPRSICSTASPNCGFGMAITPYARVMTASSLRSVPGS